MSLTRPLHFFCIFEKSGKNQATDLTVGQLRGSTIAIISAHVPGPHMWASHAARVRARARVQDIQNSGSRMVVLRFTILSARDRHRRNPRAQQYKTVHVCALTGSLNLIWPNALKAWTHQHEWSDKTNFSSINPCNHFQAVLSINRDRLLLFCIFWWI